MNTSLRAMTLLALPLLSGSLAVAGQETVGPRLGVFQSLGGSFDLTKGRLRPPREINSYQHFVLMLDATRLDQSSWAEVQRGVVKRGGRFLQDVSVSGYVVGLTPAAYRYLRARSGVAVLEPYRAEFKLSPEIGRLSSAETLDLVVLTFPDEDDPAVASFVERHGGRVVGRDRGWLHVTLGRNRLEALATLEPVWLVFEYTPNVLQGEEVGSTLQIGGWIEGTKPYHAAGVDGGGGDLPNTAPQVLMIMDGGFHLDSGELSDTRNTPGVPGPSHRKVVSYVPTNPWGGQGDLLECASYPHGTMGASVALGAATTVPPSYGWPWPPYKDRKMDGVAPGARLAAYDAGAGCFLDIGSVYGAPASGSLPDAYLNHGARTFNFSWGASSNTYNSYSTQVDRFLHDYADVLLFASAGNSGPASGTVYAPATAKNAVSVGATYSGPHPDLDQNDRWPSSSKGPTAAAQRTAPLLMAPGSDLPSDNAREIYFCFNLDDDQAGPVTCMPQEGSSGTSEASPAAAGAALLVRDYFRQGFYPDGTSDDPSNALDQVSTVSGALVKALLIASADWVGEGNLPGSNLSVPYRFNNEQGYGRIELDNVLKLASWSGSPVGLIVHDGGLPGGVSDMPALPRTLDAVFGETAVQPFEVLDPSRELRVALTWMEDSGDFLINDLDLELVSPDPDGAGPLEPVVYRGNYFTDDNNRNGVMDPGEDCPGIEGTSGALDVSPWSLPTCSNSPTDSKHTTEAIFLSPDADAGGDDDADFHQILPGTWQLRVVAPGGGTDFDQRFAVVVSGGVTVEGTVVWNGGPYTCGASATFDVLETDEAEDPAAGLTAVEVGSRVTLQVLDGTTGAVLDEESGFPLTQPDVTVLRFESGAIPLTAESSPVPSNGSIEVSDGQILRLLYADETNGVADLAKQQRTTARVSCGPVPGEAHEVLVHTHSPSGALSIVYVPACGAENHHVVFGSLADVSTYGYTGQACAIGTSGLATFDPGAGSSFFLVVGDDGVSVEASYGTDSNGIERPENTADRACPFTQELGLPCE